MYLQESFKNPDEKYRGTDLWMLNDSLKEEEIRRQITEMKKQGFYSFIARTYVGLSSDYPGPGFMKSMRIIIDEAKKQGMKVYIQAGYMPGGVINLPGEYTHTVLREVSIGGNFNGNVLFQNDGKAYILTCKTNFLDMLSSEAVDFYIKTSYEDMWDNFRDEFGKTIISVWVDEPHFSPPGLPWTRNLPELFKETWGYNIADKVYLLFQDTEDYRRVRYHYWRTVLHLLKMAYFEKVSNWCRQNGLLFSGHLMGEDTLAAQIAYTGSTMPLYKYFDIPGIDYLTVDLNWKHGQLRGFDEENYRFLNTPLQCSSIAHQLGKQEVLCEMYGVSGHNVTIKKQKYIFDYFASLGINHKCVHALFYSLKGRRKRTYPPHIGYYQPYWNDYHILTDYQARVSWFISQGRPAAEILFINPIETAFTEYKPVRENGTYNMDYYGDTDKDLNFLLQYLVGIQASFHLGDEDIIEEYGDTDEYGNFIVGQMKYRVVLISNLNVLRLSTVMKLEKFCDNGGKLLVIGKPPVMVDGDQDTERVNKLLKHKGVLLFRNYHEIGSWIRNFGCKKFEYIGEGSANVQINYREDGNEKYIFLFNNDECNKKQGKLKLKGNYIAYVLDAANGTHREMLAEQKNNETLISVNLQPGGSLLLYLEGGKVNTILERNKYPFTKAIELGSGWDVSTTNPNVLLLEYCLYKTKDKNSFSEPLTILGLQQLLTKENYKGEIVLRFPFYVETLPPGIKLALEDAKRQKITLNGAVVDTGNAAGYFMDKSFELVDLPDEFVKGENILEVTRYFEPLEKPSTYLAALFQKLNGVELEAMYLLGDFGIYTTEEPTSTNCIRLTNNFVVGCKPTFIESDLTTSGYPFYTGSCVFRKNIILDGIPEHKRVFICLQKLNACVASVSINGICAGKVCWDPFELDITGLLKSGSNKVEIKLTNTLRNLLGPYHRPVGEVGYCWGLYDSPNDPWLGEYSEVTEHRYPDWFFKRYPDTTAWTDSYLQLSFGVRDVKIVFK
ncbi:MAG TPA: glycosyl hydrolase [Clostridia bacterium]